MSPTHHILLIGGHGKVAQLLTPMLLNRSWHVTSMIRTSEQKPTIESLAQKASSPNKGNLAVLVRSVEDVKSEADAQRIIQEAGNNGQGEVDYVVWSAGAGGKGGPERTLAIDRDAAIAFTKAAVHTPSVKKILTVSYLASRRGSPPWWTDKDAQHAEKINTEILPTYYQAKVAADEVLTVLAKRRYEEEVKKGVKEEDAFCGISLRPGTLTDEPSKGVRMGKVGCDGKTSREAVAESVAAVLETSGARGWFDVVDGEKAAREEVEKCVKENVDAVEGEDLGAMEGRIKEWV